MGDLLFTAFLAATLAGGFALVCWARLRTERRRNENRIKSWRIEHEAQEDDPAAGEHAGLGSD